MTLPLTVGDAPARSVLALLLLLLRPPTRAAKAAKSTKAVEFGSRVWPHTVGGALCKPESLGRWKKLLYPDGPAAVQASLSLVCQLHSRPVHSFERQRFGDLVSYCSLAVTSAMLPSCASAVAAKQSSWRTSATRSSIQAPPIICPETANGPYCRGLKRARGCERDAWPLSLGSFSQ